MTAPQNQTITMPGVVTTTSTNTPPPVVPPAAIATPDAARGNGFPLDTKVADMTPVEQAAYWEDRARKAPSKAEFEVLKTKLDAAEAEKLSEHDKALLAARTAGKTEAQAEYAALTATTIFRSTLALRLGESSDLDELVDAFNPAKFITNGVVDTTKVAALAAKIGVAAPANGKTNGTTTIWPAMGQGQRPVSQMSGREEGLAEAARRFAKK